MLTISETIEPERFELESRVLAAAMKQSVELGDPDGAVFVHRQLFNLLRYRNHGAGNRLITPAIPQSTAIPPKIVQHQPAQVSSGGWGGLERDVPQSYGNGHQPHAAEQLVTDVPVADFDGDPQALLDTVFGVQEGGLNPDPHPEDLKNLFAGEAVRETNEPPVTASPPTIEAMPEPSLSAPEPPSDPGPVLKVKRLHAREIAAPPVNFEQLGSAIENAKDIYSILGISQYASYDTIHLAYLKCTRLLLSSSFKGYPRTTLDQLKNLSIAHDVLMDPKMRNDYDSKVAGLVAPPSDTRITSEDLDLANSPAKIGELLEGIGLLEPTELTIACDMHKAMPEMQFGRFLVKQGFIREAQLEAVLVGQRLLHDDKLSAEQFKQMMEVVNKGSDVGPALVQTAVLSQAEVSALLTAEEMQIIKNDGFRIPPPPSAKRRVTSSFGAARARATGDKLEAAQAIAEAVSMTPAADVTTGDALAVARESTPASRVQKEIKITNARLIALLDHHEAERQPQNNDTHKRTSGERSFSDRDIITDNEIDPEQAKRPLRGHGPDLF